MANEYLKPAGLFDADRFGFTQVVTSPPGKLVFVSGQTAWTEALEIAGGDDLEAQTRQALENLRLALAAAGAKPADVTQLRLYIVDYTPKDAAAIGPPLGEFFAGGKPSAQTLLGIQALASPGLRIEIEAVAVVS